MPGEPEILGLCEGALPLTCVKIMGEGAQPGTAEVGVSLGYLRNSDHVWSFSVKFSCPLGISTRSINAKVKIQSTNTVCFSLQGPAKCVWSYLTVDYLRDE